MKKHWSFFREAVRNFRATGAIASSSPALVKRLVENLPDDRPLNIVELGPGDGCVTRAILKQVHPASQLTAFEINPAFVALLDSIEDERLRILPVGAEQIMDYFTADSVDFVVSSLPLSMIPQGVKEDILRQSLIALAPEGGFYQYQYALQDYKLLKHHFGRVSISFTMANLPPAFIYSCMAG